MASHIRILLAEDDEYDAQLALKVLSASLPESDVLVVMDGKEALDFLCRRDRFAGLPPTQPVLVLLDLKMPRIDGFEVLEQAKTDPALKRIPIVVLTSSRQDRDLARAYELGANGYVVKGLRFEDYSAALRALSHYWLNVNEPPPPYSADGATSK